jgi:hypothetical protein
VRARKPHSVTKRSDHAHGCAYTRASGGTRRSRLWDVAPIEYVTLEFADDRTPDLLLLSAHLKAESEEYAACKPTFTFQGQRFKRDRFEYQRVDGGEMQTVLRCIELTDS